MSLLELAKDFHLRTVAEGIETQACSLGGPMPGGQLLGWFRQDRSHL